ncbi:response regulator transcription factor [Hufsiella ginkgonis]|uniref:Response regulator n=1 Tax=Hufsiella ginkgonis TaxID=2695274 RepID=A0A7K1XW50_9SPHI|nr:response regulator transcription factor [Hufsiella ginkgonis]MXV14999.1 response regulator [Hufsiella ginkgonis]
MTRICLIEDEEKVGAFIKKGLEENGYRVERYKETSKASDSLFAGKFDLLILDIMLPGISGAEFCRRLREKSLHIPVLMLTALGTIDDKVSGLKAGADDYLVKPFRFDELLARMEALIRRQNMFRQANESITFEGLTLNTWEKTAEREHKKITLTAKEYALLELFMRNPDKLLTRQYIAEKVWGIGFDTGTNVIDVYVNYLRNKIDKEYDVKLIHTMVGMGYILKRNL